MDEVFLFRKGQKRYLYRAIDQDGVVVDVLLREHRDTASAQAFFRQAIERTGVIPHEVVTDRHQAYFRAVATACPGARHIRTDLHRAHGETTASTLCPFPVSAPGAGCDLNQDSQPFTGPDGALYVVFSNFNTIDLNAAPPLPPAKFQVLIAKSTDGGGTFGPLQKVFNYYELPDCPTYQGQNPGRACVPEKGISKNSFFCASNYPSGGVNPKNAKQVVVSLGSYINRNSKESNGCVPTGTDPNSDGGLYTGVKTAGACNNKILISASNNGGATFNGTTTDVRNMPTASNRRQSTSDQWFQWLDFTRDGRVAVGYYDRQYGDDETTGFSDQSVAGADDLPGEFGVTRVTTSSMPPPTQFNGVF